MGALQGVRHGVYEGKHQRWNSQTSGFLIAVNPLLLISFVNVLTSHTNALVHTPCPYPYLHTIPIPLKYRGYSHYDLGSSSNGPYTYSYMGYLMKLQQLSGPILILKQLMRTSPSSLCTIFKPCRGGGGERDLNALKMQCKKNANECNPTNNVDMVQHQNNQCW